MRLILIDPRTIRYAGFVNVRIPTFEHVIVVALAILRVHRFLLIRPIKLGRHFETASRSPATIKNCMNEVPARDSERGGGNEPVIPESRYDRFCCGVVVCRANS